MKKSENTDRFLIPSVTILVFLFLWEVLARVLQVPVNILPGPLRIGWQFVLSLPQMLPHLQLTLFTAVTGLLLSLIIGLLAGALMDRVRFFKKALYPFMVISQTVPIIFIYPLLVIWFGFGLFPKILVVIIVCFFPICVNVVDGLAGVDPELVDLFRSMKAPGWRTFFWVRLPSAMPQFFSGLKISASYAVIGAVVAEWLGAKQGVAVFMIRSFKSFATDKVFASILLIIISSLVLMGLVLLAERLVISWNFRRKGQKSI
ncbi:MAG: ABC transporter permease [Spirochaetales bacterium]|nr:ABC transporter permease [Spirochaetales bacterium]